MIIKTYYRPHALHSSSSSEERRQRGVEVAAQLLHIGFASIPPTSAPEGKVGLVGVGAVLLLSLVERVSNGLIWCWVCNGGVVGADAGNTCWCC